MMEEVSGKPILGEVEFKIPKAEGRSSRRVVQSVKAGRVLLKPPYRKGERLPEVEINVVFVEEINPPEGEEPITWLLLTSLPVDTFEQACLVVEYYLCRWQVEIYFKVLKSGCKTEDRQLETSGAYQTVYCSLYDSGMAGIVCYHAWKGMPGFAVYGAFRG